MADKAAGTGQHGPHLFGCVAFVQILQHFHDGNGTQPGGGEGPVAAGALGAVDHPSLLVGGDGDAAVHMADNQVQLLIPLSQAFGMDGGNALLIQYMGLSPAVEPGNAGEPGIVAELIHIGGVHGVHGLSAGGAQLIGQHHPQLGGVIGAALVGGGVQNQLTVNGHHAAGLGIGAAPPAHKHIHVPGGQTVGAQEVQNHLLAHGHLVIGGGIFQKLRGIVKDALGIDIPFVFKIAYLGGGRAGVDNQQFHGKGSFLYFSIPYHTTFFGKRKRKSHAVPDPRGRMGYIIFLYISRVSFRGPRMA